MEKAPARNWDWLTAFLLFFLLQVSAARLITTNWAPYLDFAGALAALGTVLGLALGASRFRRGVVIWLAVAYTVVVLPWQIAGAADEKLLLDRLQDVEGILLISLGQFIQRQPVQDSLFFIAFACLVFWILSIVAGYWTARHRNILVGIIPSAIIVLMIQVYANYQLHGSLWLAVYLFIALLMIGRIYYLQRARVWSQRRVFVHEEAWPNIFGGLFIMVAAAIVIAWLLPSSIPSVQAATDTWARITRGVRDRLSNAVTSLNGTYGRPGIDFYGSRLALGENAAIGDSPVFEVEVIEAPESSLRYYWRGRVYDTYSDGQWTTASASTLDFQPAAGNLKVPGVQGRSEAQMGFTVEFPAQSLLYAPSEPVWVDRPANVEIAPADGGLEDILSWRTKRSISSGTRYQVRAEIGDPDVQQLRAASTSYPKWIQDRYLEVPGNIRPEIQSLAEKVAAGAANPFDKASAITNYLRLNLQYSASVPRAPEGRDPVEWVLFTYKKGFCNYYASAEVLMLRSLGVPARLAVGFAQGQHENNKYIVRKRDAHAWPEVFFPGLGWVEFEPTVSQQPLVRTDLTAQANSAAPNRPPGRPASEGDQAAADSSGTQNGAKAIPFVQSPVGRALIISLSLVSLGLLVYWLYRSRALTLVPVVLSRAFESNGASTPAWIENWLHWNRLEPEEQAFAPINWSLRWLDAPAPVHASPAERAASLVKLLPLATAHIETVASELETGLFSPQPADLPRARRAGFMVLVHALRARVMKLLGMSKGRDVYSR